MTKELRIHLNRYSVYPVRRLYGEESHIHKESMRHVDTTLYMMCRTKRLRWIPSTAKFTLDYNLQCSVKIGDLEKGIQYVDMLDYWMKLPNIASFTTDRKIFSEYIMSRTERSLYTRLPYSIQYKLLSSIVSVSPCKDIIINCSIKRNLTVERDGACVLPVYQMASLYQWSIGIQFEIVYVGLSEQSTTDRLVPHNKWGEVFAYTEDDEDVMVYQFEISNSLVVNNIVPGENIIAEISSAINRKQIAEITEAYLINIFKPQHNSTYKDGNLSNTKVYKLLQSLSVDSVRLEVRLPGPMGNIGTVFVGYGEHTFYKKLNS